MVLEFMQILMFVQIRMLSRIYQLLKKPPPPQPLPA
jgi:hypothetical protein